MTYIYTYYTYTMQIFVKKKIDGNKKRYEFWTEASFTQDVARVYTCILYFF